MKKLILLFTLIFSGFVFGQVKDTIIDGKKVEIYSSIEKVAVFPKGNNEFRNMISKNFRMENIIGTENIHSEVTFIIAKDGSITDIKATGNNESFNKEAVFAVSMIKEKWIPAEINGQKVRYRIKIPLDIHFENANGTARFPNGEDAFKNIISENLKNKNFENQEDDQCLISFVVESSGFVHKINVEGENKKLNKEVKKIISKIKELWEPKYIRGIAVPSEVKIQFEYK